MIYSEWLSWLIRFPCPLCDRPVASGQGCFCQDCQDQLHTLRYRPWCSVEPGEDLPIYAWGVYQDPLRRALQQLKYDGRGRIGLTLGRWLGECWRTSGPQRSRYTVVPIPLHRDRLQQRGYNQAELISQGFCQVTGLEHRPRSLSRCRLTQPQYGLTAAERQENIQAAFEAKPLPRTPVLLIDDIYTTGSTMRSAAQSLRQIGVKVAGAVVIARVPLPSQSTTRSLRY